MKSLRSRFGTWVALVREITRGESGMVDIQKIIMTVILAFVGIMFILNIQPELEAAILAYTGTNTFVIAMLDMAEWMLPVGAIIGIFFGIFMLFRAGGKGRG